MHTKSGVYKITNLKNGKVYVGSSRDIWGRWRIHYDHLERSRHCNEKLQADWNQYGELNFVFEVVLHSSLESLFAYEKFVIRVLKQQLGNDKLFNINMVDKGINGERLTDDEAREIKRRVAAGETKKSLAKEFGGGIWHGE